MIFKETPGPMTEPRHQTIEVTVPIQDGESQEHLVKVLRQALSSMGIPFTVACRPAEPELPGEPEPLTPVFISPLALLRSMLAILWSALRHPFSTTTIDLATGKVIART
jgi:hypothetical protein